MSEMIDRVAMALKQVWEAGDKNPEYGELARAAIEAMREPTEAMIQAAKNTDYGSDDFGAGPSTHWHEMIDAALASNEPQAG